jgi:hypothetical protein
MPYDLFCRRLFAGASKVLSMQGVQKNAYDPENKRQVGSVGGVTPLLCFHRAIRVLIPLGSARSTSSMG